MQLAAGAEHLISGKTVRVNLAGPRPELPLLYMDPSQTQPILLPQTTGKHPLTFHYLFLLCTGRILVTGRLSAV